MALNKKQNHTEKETEQSEMMKKFKQNPAVFIGTVFVLVLIVVTFVFWGAGDWILPKSGVLSDDQLTFGYYNKIPIELSPGSFFAEQREYNIQQQRQIRSDRMATEEAFKSTAIRTALLDAMKNAHYEPPKEVIDREVAKLPRYQEDGKFSVLRWREEDAARKAQIYKSVRENFIVNRYIADVAGQQIDDGRSDPNVWTAPKYSYAVLTSSKEAEFAGNMAKKQRKFKIAIFPYSQFPDDEIKAFIEKNPDTFKNTQLSQITILSSKAESEIKKVRDSIQNGSTTFEDAAKAHSEDAYKETGGDAGKRMAYELNSLIGDEAARKTVINLGAGELSEPVKVSSGWAIFRAESAAVSADMADKATLDKIRNYMNDSERGVVENWLIARAQAFGKSVESSGWDTAVIAHNPESKEFGPVPLNYGNSTIFSTVQSFSSDISALRAAGTSDNFWKTAFITPVGKPSEPFVISSDQQNVVVILPLEETEDDEAVKNSTNYFKNSFLTNDVFQSVENAILNSPKFQDNFDKRYTELFVRDSF